MIRDRFTIPLFFPQSWLIVDFLTRVTRRELLVEQELFALPGAHEFTTGFKWVRVVQSSVLRVVLCRHFFFSLFIFLLVIALFVLLQFTASDHIFVSTIFFLNFVNITQILVKCKLLHVRFSILVKFMIKVKSYSFLFLEDIYFQVKQFKLIFIT